MKFPSLKKIKFQRPHKIKYEFRTIGDKANFDWKLILVGFGILGLVAVALSFYVFIKVSKGEIFTVTPENNLKKTEVDAEGLERINKYFEERKNYLDSLRANPPRRIDPSL